MFLPLFTIPKMPRLSCNTSKHSSTFLSDYPIIIIFLYGMIMACCLHVPANIGPYMDIPPLPDPPHISSLK